MTKLIFSSFLGGGIYILKINPAIWLGLTFMLRRFVYDWVRLDYRLTGLDLVEVNPSLAANQTEIDTTVDAALEVTYIHNRSLLLWGMDRISVLAGYPAFCISIRSLNSVFSIQPGRIIETIGRISGIWLSIKAESFAYDSTVCPRSSDPFCVVTYYTKWVTTSWTYSTYVQWRIHGERMFKRGEKWVKIRENWQI